MLGKHAVAALCPLMSFLTPSDSAVIVDHIFSGRRDPISLCCVSLKSETIRTLMVMQQHLCFACTAIQDIQGD
jgi:hypothetical protein